MKYKKWMPPLIVIAALLLALVLRWHMEAYKNYDDGIVKYYRDTWTGNVWLKRDRIGAHGDDRCRLSEKPKRNRR